VPISAHRFITTVRLSMCAIWNCFADAGVNIIAPMENRRGLQLDAREQKNVDRRRSYADFLERLTQGVSTILQGPPPAASTKASVAIASPPRRFDPR
jgi:hypothetical protein